MANPIPVPGTRGYAQQAHALIPQYESVPFARKYEGLLDYFPDAPARILDVGAGTGADAAWLASAGHTVLAVEPTAAFREAALQLHPHAEIEWLDDSLPSLEAVRARGESWQVILLSAVWMHLAAGERAQAMGVLASLLRSGGTMFMSLRHGPIPEGRLMFEVGASETIELAQRVGLVAIHADEAESTQAANRAAGVTWTRLVFRNGG